MESAGAHCDANPLVRAATIAACLAFAATAAAQFRHPFKGTWGGEWGPSKDNRTHVVMEIRWDGKQLTGILNPGANATVMKTTTLDPASWIVHFEGDGKSATGAAVRYVIDGKLENIGAYARFMTGTWTQLHYPITREWTGLLREQSRGVVS